MMRKQHVQQHVGIFVRDKICTVGFRRKLKSKNDLKFCLKHRENRFVSEPNDSVLATENQWLKKNFS